MTFGAWPALRAVALTVLAACSVATALADEKPVTPTNARLSKTELDAIVDQAVARYRLPGIAVGVIEEGKIVYVGTRGETISGSGRPITSNTLFKIASNSKAMTASVLARLVDAGKLRWEDPVIKYLPSFRMYDPWVTRNMQVKDLLVHNSGLPEGGGDLMLWPEPNRFTRADIIAGLAHIKPAYSFRSGYAYDNLLYVVAGEVAAAAGGASYEELVQRELFEPLGLSRCRVGAWRLDQVGDVAQPHNRVDGHNAVVKADDAVVEPLVSAAAGGIRCSLDDMLAWANNWLAPDSKQQAWLSAEQRQAAWVPRTPMPISARRRAWDGTRLFAYGYGWRIADVDGAYTVSHTGTLSGMYSVMTLLPDRKSGFVVLINGEAETARTVLNEVLLKRFTKPADDRGVAYYADELQRESESKKTVAQQPDIGREAPTLKQFEQWWGVYRDPWFGKTRICPDDGQARFVAEKSPMLSGRIMRSGSRYLVDWDHDSVDAEAWLDFHPATASQPARLTLAKVDPEADFSYDYEDLAFERVSGCE
ncbi:MAG TPA: serine hydrolase [Pseudoxanthomonas sp.]